MTTAIGGFDPGPSSFWKTLRVLVTPPDSYLVTHYRMLHFPIYDLSSFDELVSGNA